MNTLNPSLQEFTARAKQLFGFLASEYGFSESPSDAVPGAQPFQLRYENETTAVLIEGQSWGTAATVSIGEKNAKRKSDFDLVPLWTLARLRGAEHEASLHISGQLAQLEANAVALQSLAGAALWGDFSAVEAGRAYLEDRVRKATRG